MTLLDLVFGPLTFVLILVKRDKGDKVADLKI